jgi:hypothetical protein
VCFSDLAPAVDQVSGSDGDRIDRLDLGRLLAGVEEDREDEGQDENGQKQELDCGFHGFSFG